VSAAARPFPEPVAPDFADFFSGLSQRRLTVRRCAGCEAIQWPPRPVCSRCHGDEFRPAVIGDRGTVYTFTVCHRGFHPWFAERVPYAIVVTDLGDGIRLTGNYLGDDLDGLRCGLAVRAEYVGSCLGWVPA